WRTQRLDFDDSSLADVITDLEKSFNKSIAFYPEKLGQCRFTGSFQDPALDEVLEIISATMNLTVETTATGFAMRGEGCNQF
ncbi:MAG: DUF4974 domain-containing protein, partial [Cyclobacteriaceae bacterium]